MSNVKKILKCAVVFTLAFVLALSSVFTGSNTINVKAAGKVTKITVKKKITLQPKKSVKIPVTIKGGNKKFTAKSSNKKIVTVQVVGKKVKIKAKKKTGKATIKIVTKGKNKKGKKLKAKIAVTVRKQSGAATNPEEKYNNVKITTPTTSDGSTPTINVGTSTKLTADVDAADAASVKWKSSDTGVAVVTEDGTVTGVAAGTTEIIATMNGKEIGKVSVTISSVAVTGVTLDRNEITLTENNTATLTATIEPANATVRTVTWSSSDDSIATVSSTGVVRAIKEGEATITVTTTDKNFTAECKVTVTSDAKENVNGIQLKVTNALDGFDNTVLVGTGARISATVLKDGAPIREEIQVTLEEVSGYTDYYVTSLDGDSGFTKTDAEDGTATFTVALNNANQDKKPILSSVSANAADERAYASFRVKVIASGSSYEEVIPLSFAQVLAETDESSAAIAVDNLYDASLQPLEGTGSAASTDMSVGYTTDKKNGYQQEYVVDQQVSTNQKDHTVYLDASPMLILPTTVGKVQSSNYEETMNYTVSEYSVYANEESAYTLRNVPAGLQYLTLYFDKLKLSEYTRIVVRAYRADTNIPLLNGDNLIQEFINSDTSITAGAGGNTVQIAQEIFKQTVGEKMIDLKIFVESAGQVNENDNIGFTITRAVGKWENQEIKPFDLQRISNAVTWEIDNTDYTASMELTNASQLLGSDYTPNNRYTVSLPTFPSVGAAIITEWLGTSDTIVNCYVHPTIANYILQNGLVQLSSERNKNELRPTRTDEYTFMGSTSSSNALSISKNTDEENRLMVDSKIVGHAQIKATINFGPSGDKGVHYEVYSAVQFSPIPANEVEIPTDFYALAGQKITVKVEVSDENGNVVPNFVPEWEGLEDAANRGINIDKQDPKTNSAGVAYLELTAAKGSVLPELFLDSNRYNVQVSVDGNYVDNNLITLKWVRPGVYYKDSVDGVEYDTSRPSDSKVIARTSNYKVTDTWIIGTQVCGVVGIDGDNDNAIREDEVDEEIEEIRNIEIAMDASADDPEINTELNHLSNGVCKWSNTKTGAAKLTAGVVGVEVGKKPVFVLEDGTTAVGVGTGDVTSFAQLEIPVNWEVNGANLTLINNNAIYNYNNTLKPRVYFQILDDEGNSVPSTEVVYSISNGSNMIVEPDPANPVTIENGLGFIEVNCPDSALTYTISAYIKNSGTSATKTTTIQFKDASDVFTLNAGTISEDLDAKTLTFTFSQPVDAKLVNKDTADFFVVTKQDGVTTVKVTDVTVDASNKQKVVLKLSDIENGMNLQIDPVVTIDDIRYLLIDQNGTFYSEAAN